MLVSIHIPKTAGTAWRLFIERNAGNRASFASVESRDRNAVATRALAFLESGDEDGARAVFGMPNGTLVHGHQTLPLARLFPEAAVLLWLRDPVERLISEFHQLRARPQKAGSIQAGVHAGDVGITEYARAVRNLYAQMFDMLDTRPGPYAVLLNDRSDEAALLCREVLDWRGSIQKRNVSPRRKEDVVIGESDLASIEDILDEERRIHALWKSAWDAQTAQSRAREVLSYGPERQTPLLGAVIRRQIGIWKEAVGHRIGRDWR